MANDKQAVSNEEEAEHVERASNLPSKLIYEVIRRDGDEELTRPTSSLMWSGVAAGVMISLSVLGEAIFRANLPDAPWRHLIENIGYSFGFLVVILGRMQLFTENTITTVLPFVSKPRFSVGFSVLRLWGIVLLANVIGAFFAAALYACTTAVTPEVQAAILELSHHALDMPFWQAFFRAIPAGVLVASIVWMLPQAREASFFVILTFTWIIAAADLTHIIAGSVEMAYLLLLGEIGIVAAVFGFFLPVLAGNVIGGTAIFTMMAWGQVQAEVESE
ncbi:formate/nitrite transporter family protein [Algicella marina]|uniref:Formate/nitrite transporter family protein n=1 Tax=Algicella marina TaxID=2683284 RepID=A0A6P1T9L0_9RHOB|nr:formate/nitrite transporter family protein [Algicella marina]QHQ37322.1 formate/nitrite transporter family protein [Algicella marina]